MARQRPEASAGSIYLGKANLQDPISISIFFAIKIALNRDKNYNLHK
jgi:hypothetical protein